MKTDPKTYADRLAENARLRSTLMSAADQLESRVDPLQVAQQIRKALGKE